MVEFYSIGSFVFKLVVNKFLNAVLFYLLYVTAFIFFTNICFQVKYGQ